MTYMIPMVDWNYRSGRSKRFSDFSYFHFLRNRHTRLMFANLASHIDEFSPHFRPAFFLLYLGGASTCLFRLSQDPHLSIFVSDVNEEQLFLNR